MSDLLARLAQRPQSREGYIDWELDRAEFDRDIALDALALVHKCNTSVCAFTARKCVQLCQADEIARTILRKLRGATSGEGAGHAD